MWCPGGDNQHVPDAAEDNNTMTVSKFEIGIDTDVKNLFEMLIQQCGPQADDENGHKSTQKIDPSHLERIDVNNHFATHNI
ncbi:MAG: hypothetical protein NT175_04395 [Bacteroidetes bacterium]|nr:hypothetical protein [Bacteroidota bacterium]